MLLTILRAAGAAVAALLALVLLLQWRRKRHAVYRLQAKETEDEERRQRMEQLRGGLTGFEDGDDLLPVSPTPNVLLAVAMETVSKLRCHRRLVHSIPLASVFGRNG